MFNPNSYSALALSKIEKDTPISTIEALSASLMEHNKAAKRTGRWTLDEKILFLYGLRKYGKGRYVCTKSVVICSNWLWCEETDMLLLLFFLF
jgi:hypothetical protein